MTRHSTSCCAIATAFSRVFHWCTRGVREIVSAVDSLATRGCGRRSRRVRLWRHDRAGVALAPARPAAGRRDRRIGSGSRMGSAAAARNSAYRGRPARRVPCGVTDRRVAMSACASWMRIRSSLRRAIGRTAKAAFPIPATRQASSLPRLPHPCTGRSIRLSAPASWVAGCRVSRTSGARQRRASMRSWRALRRPPFASRTLRR